jgi:filamentous hemagglutinin family protein
VAIVSARAGIIRLDNSLGNSGSVITPVGQIYTLPSSLGVRSGANLFYSFGQFQLYQGETANFTSASAVSNVFCRVTAAPCSIDGTLECSIPNANFYLVDSQGIIFGPGAQLNISGSFTVTTADEIKFADGHFYTAVPSVSDVTLTSAAPAAFGFLAAKPAPVTVNGSNPTFGVNSAPVYHPTLQTTGSSSLAIVAGNITIIGGELASGGTGSAQVVSVGSPGIGVINPPNAATPYDLGSFSSLGQISVSAGGLIGAHGIGGADAGSVSIQAGSLNISGDVEGFFSAVGSFSGTGAAGNVQVFLPGDLSITGGGELGSGASEELGTEGTNSGLVQVSARNITLSGFGPGADSVLGSYSGTGIDGSVIVSAQNLSVSANGGVGTQALGQMSSGDVTIAVRNSTILDGDGGSPSVLTGITAGNIVAQTGGAGNVTLQTGSLKIEHNAQIESATSSSGRAGNLTISVNGEATLIGIQSDPILTGITAQANPTASANAGNVTFSADSLQLENGAAIISISSGLGSGGDINVNSGSITIESGAKIDAESLGPNSAGNIAVIADGNVSLFNGGYIKVDAHSNIAGNLSVSSKGGIALFSSSYFSANSNGENGTGGNITVNSANLTLDDASILANSSGHGGSITLSTIPGNLTQQSSTISATAGSDGNINISTAPDSNVLILDSTINAKAAGNGGHITIDPNVVALGDSTINGLSGGTPVTVAIDAGALLVSSDSQILTAAPEFTVDTNVVAGLVLLPAATFGGQLELAPTCVEMIPANTSSFVTTGNSGLPIQPGSWLPPDAQTTPKRP